MKDLIYEKLLEHTNKILKKENPTEEEMRFLIEMHHEIEEREQKEKFEIERKRMFTSMFAESEVN